MTAWDDLAREIDTARLGDGSLGHYQADTGEHVIEVWFDDNRHFRVFVADVIEVNE